MQYGGFAALNIPSAAFLISNPAGKLNSQAAPFDSAGVIVELQRFVAGNQTVPSKIKVAPAAGALRSGAQRV
ncbi:MAG: hypothetical protein IPN92_20735 [Chromatiaceae bacterium]|nr:hypothetical protein [Chromatiaceae bacterium]